MNLESKARILGWTLEFIHGNGIDEDMWICPNTANAYYVLPKDVIEAEYTGLADKLQDAWDEYMKVYSEVAPKIAKLGYHLRLSKEACWGVVTTNDHKLVIMDQHPFSCWKNISFDEVKEFLTKTT